MDTAIIITGIIGLGAGLSIGAVYWGHHSDTVKAQAEEIEALQSDNLRLRGQAAELAAMAHKSQDGLDMAKDMLSGEIEAHRSTKRKLSAADGPRYKAIGNSMAVPVMRWIGERIRLVSDLTA